ncbi:hypothetical protein PC128_g13739 [Phytophthora cactorum]|nr:hypothetical protein PC121_g10279 [Phytophthora cactorum]KAG3184439.1 hypothetical protein PC128_g13739 [Phytophthora cactorum]
MDVAAENGRVDVVELLCEHAKQSSEVYYSKYRPASKRSNALSLAISGGHVGVVRALLTPVRLHWDVGAAFELALAEGHQKVVTFMHRALPMYLAATKIGENYDMIVHMARDGHLRSVEYLFEHGHDSLSVAGKTFYIAAVYQRTKIISFLLGTGRVCPKAFDAAFERVCHSGLLDMVELLYMYEKKRASIESIRRAFVNARTLQVIRFLYLKEDIPQDCLHTLVEACIQRMDSKTNSHNQNQKECARILEFLFNQGRIPETLVTRTVEAAATSNTARLVGVFCKRGRVSLEVAAKAFTAAANSDSVDVVEVMWTKRLVSRETMMQALMSAASGGNTIAVCRILTLKSFSSDVITQILKAAALEGHQCIAQLLYEKFRTPCQVMRELFEEAALSGDCKMVALLAEVPSISRSANKALLCAIQQGRKGIVECLVTRGYWPRHKLKEALQVAEIVKIQEVLRKVLSNNG